MRPHPLALLLVGCLRPAAVVAPEVVPACADTPCCIAEVVRSEQAGPAAFNPHTGCVEVDPVQLTHLRASFGYDAEVAVLLVELARLTQHRSDLPPDDELADLLAGCWLSRLGLSPSGLVAWLRSRGSRVWQAREQRLSVGCSP